MGRNRIGAIRGLVPNQTGRWGEALNAEGDGQPDWNHLHHRAVNQVPSRNGLSHMRSGEWKHDQIHDQVEAIAEEQSAYQRMFPKKEDAASGWVIDGR